jgi:hypothetical protein
MAKQIAGSKVLLLGSGFGILSAIATFEPR